MSIFSTILSVGKAAVGYLSSGTGSAILKTVLTAYALRKVNQSMKKVNPPSVPTPAFTSGGGGAARVSGGSGFSGASASNFSTSVDAPRQDAPIVNRGTVEASQDNKVPVIYGNAQLSGVITEARMNLGNTRMTLVYTLSEKTGTLLSTSAASVFSFQNIYYNDEKLVFETSGANAGITAVHSLDRDGNINPSVKGVVRVYCYDGNSTTPRVPVGYTNGSVPAAYTVVPNWTSNHSMSDLVFAVVQVDYNSDQGSTTIGNFRFDITNTMTLPGDCLLDYMTNARYGAGIPAEDIYT
jgi:hypothetical protein